MSDMVGTQIVGFLTHRLKCYEPVQKLVAMLDTCKTSPYLKGYNI